MSTRTTQQIETEIQAIKDANPLGQSPHQGTLTFPFPYLLSG